MLRVFVEQNDKLEKEHSHLVSWGPFRNQEASDTIFKILGRRVFLLIACLLYVVEKHVSYVGGNTNKCFRIAKSQTRERTFSLGCGALAGPRRPAILATGSRLLSALVVRLLAAGFGKPCASCCNSNTQGTSYSKMKSSRKNTLIWSRGPFRN